MRVSESRIEFICSNSSEVCERPQVGASVAGFASLCRRSQIPIALVRFVSRLEIATGLWIIRTAFETATTIIELHQFYRYFVPRDNFLPTIIIPRSQTSIYAFHFQSPIFDSRKTTFSSRKKKSNCEENLGATIYHAIVSYIALQFSIVFDLIPVIHLRFPVFQITRDMFHYKFDVECLDSVPRNARTFPEWFALHTKVVSTETFFSRQPFETRGEEEVESRDGLFQFNIVGMPG